MNDNRLASVICPHCKGTAKVPRVQVFEEQTLIFLKCEHCDKCISKEQIQNTYREYYEEGR